MRCAAFLDPWAVLLDPPPAFGVRLLALLIRLDVSLCHRPALALRPRDIKRDRPAFTNQRWERKGGRPTTALSSTNQQIRLYGAIASLIER